MRAHNKFFRPLDLMRVLATVSLLCGAGFRSLGADTHYVSLDGGNVSPYTNGWTSAARNIQDALGKAANGDTVLVSNGEARRVTTSTRRTIP